MTNNVRLNERPISAARAAEITGYSRSHIYRLVSEKRIPFHKMGSFKGKGAIRFFESELTNWMSNDWSFSPAQDDLHKQAEAILSRCKK